MRLDGKGNEGTCSRERRSAPRVELVPALVVEIRSEKLHYSGLLKNLSLTGAFVETNKIHTVGEDVNLRFRLPGEGHDVEVRGLVMNPRRSRGDTEGMGVWFPAPPGELSQEMGTLLGQVDNPERTNDGSWNHWS